MKKALLIILFILSGVMGGVTALVSLRFSACIFELYEKYDTLHNTLSLSHHNYGHIHLTAQIYISNEAIPGKQPCIKNVYAKMYYRGITILKPLFIGRYYIPIESGIIGNIDTCNPTSFNKWQHIQWEKDGVYLGDKNNGVFFDLDSISFKNRY
ncbi:hypothetical protein S715_001086 [Salmonella enterica subsp. enterica]|nr:hypothetical protein [Salmonella enterica subsp. enterica]